jgi:5-(carboxyamino)imidazole ribonucleotide synthase
MTFDEKSNLVEDLFSPANITQQEQEKMERLAIKIIEKLNMVGLLAVEFFVDAKGEIVVN